MNEKIKRKEKPAGGNGDGSIFDGAADLPVNVNVNVSSGPYSEDLPIAGTSVGEVRRKFGDRFDIDDKAQAIVNGHAVDNDVVLQAGEVLMFVRHAGEKGGKCSILIEGDQATAHDTSGISGTMSVTRLLQASGASQISTQSVVLSFGVKAVLSQGPMTLVVWEKPPHIARLSWIRSDSPRPYGGGTTYRNVRIALPYLVIMAMFIRCNNGRLALQIESNECFFRNEPLRSLDDELSYPALLNCSVMRGDHSPLAWICTQYLKAKPAKRLDDGGLLAAGLEAVRYCLLETSFNLSSEHHEGNSWFGVSRTKIKEVSSVEKWEEETKADPLFAIRVPWLPTKHTVAQFAERTFKRLNAGVGAAQNANDLARLILNG